MSNLSFLRAATRFTIALAIIFFFVGCSGGGGSSNSDSSLPSNGGSGNPLAEGRTPLERLIEKYESEKSLELDRSDDLAGPDVNNNGARDDVEDYIIKKYPSEGQKRALLQFARNAQKEILVDKNDEAAVRVTFENGLKAVSCMREVFPPDIGENKSATHKEIDSIILNTRARLKADYDFAKALFNRKQSFTVINEPTWRATNGDTCE
ncbi:MAG: hypothetical protein LBU73_03135 [Helicobacteraceae bacterium]|jgi:hypothetical protein|nr:hypothetical protein [Helicobacteraceae bacterium]